MVGKEENASYQHFLLFLQYLRKAFSSEVTKSSLCSTGLLTVQRALTLSETKNFRLFQTQQFADDNFKHGENDRKFFK